MTAPGDAHAAGTGARIALLNRNARAEIEQVVKRIEKVETAVEPRFQELFVDAMGFPHGTVATPHLAGETALPARSGATGPDVRGRRSGRARRRPTPH